MTVLNRDKLLERLDLIKNAIETVKESGNRDRKISGQKVMDGHYAKALQELIVVQVHVEKLLDREKALTGKEQ